MERSTGQHKLPNAQENLRIMGSSNAKGGNTTMAINLEQILEAVKGIIEKMKPGTYTLDELLKNVPLAENIPSHDKASLGNMLRDAVKDGKIPGIASVPKEGNGPDEYKIG